MSELLPQQFTIQEARWPADQPDILQLFREYKAEIGIDLCFHEFELELNGLPGEYAPPRGLLLVARDWEQVAAGCVALRPLNEGICEMKRLFVRQPFRGQRLGQELAISIVSHAKLFGYQKMCLDTLDSMKAARSLYQSLGFEEIPAYYDNDFKNVIYLQLNLS